MHFWIIEVTDKSERWGWRPEATGRGGLDVIAFPTKAAAWDDLYEKRRIYGKARLTKYVPEDSQP